MKTSPVEPEDLSGVFAVPPLARSLDASRAIDFEQNDAIVCHILEGGITRFLYGGNAFLYHITIAEYEQLLAWLNGFAEDLWAIPAVGPSYGRAMDQAQLLKRFAFPCAMILPCADPRDIKGLERGYREVAEVANTKLMVYLKEETNLGADQEAGLDMVARLVQDGVCVGIKYAVVREDPTHDGYLDALLKRVDRRFVISGIGERPAVIHLRDWKLPGFTTGSGCIAPRLSDLLFEACSQENFAAAEKLRAYFIAHEDLRDQWSPAKVLHFATELAQIASMGQVPPYLSALSDEQLEAIAPIARALKEQNASALMLVE
jgi:dihydrodipicolinate synthase/N-acetylneuraminate lyase